MFIITKRYRHSIFKSMQRGQTNVNAQETASNKTYILIRVPTEPGNRESPVYRMGTVYPTVFYVRQALTINLSS